MTTINWKNLGYRKGTVAFILNNNNEILLVQKNVFKENEWDGPGGGIDEGESADEAILRELKEELGSDKFEILKLSRKVDQYLWPKEIIEKRFLELGKTFKGQKRKQYLVKFLGAENEIKIKKEELKNIKWIKIGELKKYLVFPGYFERIQKVLKEFGIFE